VIARLPTGRSSTDTAALAGQRSSPPPPTGRLLGTSCERVVRPGADDCNHWTKRARVSRRLGLLLVVRRESLPGPAGDARIAPESGSREVPLADRSARRSRPGVAAHTAMDRSGVSPAAEALLDGCCVQRIGRGIKSTVRVADARLTMCNACGQPIVPGQRRARSFSGWRPYVHVDPVDCPALGAPLGQAGAATGGIRPSAGAPRGQR
jgi:hypothetical protein